MARLHDRKRHRADEASQDDRPAKARKKDEPETERLRNHHSAARTRRDRDQAAVEHHDSSSWQYPPEFWDRLSTIPLIHDALEELDRRTRIRPSFPPPPTGLAQDVAPTTPKELARFARHGGPNLCDLRGYPEPTASNTNHRPASTVAIAMSSSSRSRATKSTDPTTAPTKSTKTRKSITAYNRGFEQHLTDHAIHSTWKSQKPNLEKIQAALAVPRPSLSPSQFSDGAFETFQETDAQAKDEEDVNRHVVPTITGAKRANQPYSMNTKFANLEPLTDGTIAPAQPDMYYGAYPEQLDPSIRNELGRHIIPSTMVEKPTAPNYFLESKGPNGSLAVATRQARYDGATGARAMHSLQNYGQDKKAYDGNAYTFSSTYHGGQLKMYAHHATAPITSGEQPEYHMTQLRTFGMTDRRETFVEGATAFRNGRDLAKQHRDTFIRAANSRTQRGAAATPKTLPITEKQLDYNSSSDEYLDCEDHLGPDDVDGQPFASYQQQQNSVDDQRDYSQISGSFDAATEQAASFATSFTSSLTPSLPSSSKRHRSSQSPPSGSHRSKKHVSARGYNTPRLEQAGERKGKGGGYCWEWEY